MAADISQVGDFQSLRDGRFDGDTPVASLLQHGDFGIGAYNRLDGEMILLEGRFTRVSGFGEGHAPLTDARTPFAFVTRFHPDHVHKVTHPLTSEEVQALIDKMSGEGILAIRISGRFQHLLARSFSAQAEPYYPFQTILDREHKFSLGDIEGDFVGFRMPKSLVEGNLNVPGYHFHFLTADRHRGGHVLRYGLDHGTIQIMRVGKIVRIS
ncbi:acetolactate decarboxylase [bacterium]|nr:MAG: acetolactate decarboxylase [bacterium]